MVVVVIGLGSMGKRRIRLIKKHNKDIQIIGIDTNKERRIECTKDYQIETSEDLINLNNKIKINSAFVCTSPLSHNDIIKQCLELEINVFTELNLVDDGYDENIQLAKDKNLTLFMSSTFLYRDEIIKIKSLVNESESLLNYTYHVGQYLPDWHPWENYRDFFVGDKRTNGCREIFAIELPWLTDTFGEIVEIDVVKNKISDLDIDYNDNYLVIVQHNSGHKGMLAIDVVSRKAVRNLEIFGQDLSVNWDGSPTGLNKFDINKKENINIQLYDEIDQLENYSSFVVENAYSNEISAFFDSVLNDKPAKYTFAQDKKILKIIDEIEA